MFVKRSEGPRAVRLPGGRMMTRAELPDPKTVRWVASRKAAVARAVECGLISVDEACNLYGLSREELDSWAGAVSRHGEVALKATHAQRYRQL